MRAGKRLAKVEQALAERERDGSAPRVVVCLPRKDGADTPVGVVERRGNVLTVRYDRAEPFPALPAGW